MEHPADAAFDAREARDPTSGWALSATYTMSDMRRSFRAGWDEGIAAKARSELGLTKAKPGEREAFKDHPATAGFERFLDVTLEELDERPFGGFSDFSDDQLFRFGWDARGEQDAKEPKRG